MSDRLDMSLYFPFLKENGRLIVYDEKQTAPTINCRARFLINS